MTPAVLRSAPAPEVPAAAAADLLALADDELLMGHRHSEWLGLSPFLEEDLTTASIAQDEIGHARALYALVWPGWATRDADVVRRPPEEWRSGPLSELEGVPWERALLRHWLHDLVEPHRWRAVVTAHGRAVTGLAELAERVEDEERFHRAHAGTLVGRLASVGSARTRLEAQLDALLDALGVTLARMPVAHATDAAADVRAALGAVGLAAHELRDAVPGDPSVRHPDAASALAQLLEVFAFDPTATW